MSSLTAPTGLLIGGEWQQTEKRLQVMDPATFTVLAEIGDAGVADGLDAVSAASDAFQTWSVTPARQRAEVLRRAFEIMTAELETCARIISLENGKAWRDALGEATYAAEFFRWFSEEASRIEGGFRYAPNRDKTIITDHRPMGVAYMITPWNFPAAMATRKLAPALAAGCTAVLKPAGETPLTALWIGDVLQRAGAPAGVVNIITTSQTGPVSSAILADPRIATLSFTGSTYVGKMLLKQTAERVLPSSMELGGNAPFIAFEGADVDAAVAGAMIAKMRNGGAACTAANRFYIHASLAEEFTTKLETAFAGLKVGPGIDAAQRPRRHGVGQGARQDPRAAAGGGRRGRRGDPVVDGSRARCVHRPLRRARRGPRLHADAQRGVRPGRARSSTFEDEDEGVRMANDTEYGLISYVFAKDPGTGVKLARRMESGMVAVNRGLASDPAAPFGGMKESGLGREGGFAGIHEFLETQYFAVDL